MKTFLKRFRKNESGATAIEYGLIAAIISLAIVAGATVAGPALDRTFDTIGERLNTASPAAGG